MDKNKLYEIMQSAVATPTKVECVDKNAARRLRDRMQRLRSKVGAFHGLRLEVHDKEIHIKPFTRSPIVKVEPLV